MSQTLLLDAAPLPLDTDSPPLGLLDAEAGALPPLTDPEADRLIDRLASMDERAARIKRQAEAIAKEIERERDGILFQHGDRLKEWTARHLYGRKRSVKRLYGTAGFRTVPGRVTVTCPEAALKWARAECPEALRETLDAKRLPVTERPDPQTGEVLHEVPVGCEWVPERASFYVRGIRPENGQEGEGDE